MLYLCRYYYFQHPLVVSKVKHPSWQINNALAMLAFNTAGTWQITRERWTWSLLGAWTTGAQPHRDAFPIARQLTVVLNSTLMWLCSGALSQFRLRHDVWSGTFCQKSLGARLTNVPSMSTDGVKGRQDRNPGMDIHVCMSAQFPSGTKYSMRSHLLWAHSK